MAATFGGLFTYTRVMTPESLAFLKSLLDTPGPSAFEAAPARVWRAEAQRFAGQRARRRGRQLVRDARRRGAAPGHVRRAHRRDRRDGDPHRRRRLRQLRYHRRLGSPGVRGTAGAAAGPARAGAGRGRQEGHPHHGQGRPGEGLQGRGSLDRRRRRQPRRSRAAAPDRRSRACSPPACSSFRTAGS